MVVLVRSGPTIRSAARARRRRAGSRAAGWRPSPCRGPLSARSAWAANSPGRGTPCRSATSSGTRVIQPSPVGSMWWRTQVGICRRSVHSERRCRYLAWPSSKPFSAPKRQLPWRRVIRPTTTASSASSSEGMSSRRAAAARRRRRRSTRSQALRRRVGSRTRARRPKPGLDATRRRPDPSPSRTSDSCSPSSISPSAWSPPRFDHVTGYQ